MVPDDFDRLADVVLYNGKVITVDSDNTVAEAVAVKMGRIVKVGSSSEITSMTGKGTVVIDLAGRSVLPGLTDCHVHMISGAAEDLDPNILDCRDFYHPEIKSIEDIVDKIRGQARKIPSGSWIMANGSAMADFRMKESRYPTRWDLDRATKDHPAFISFGAHITVVNSLALEVAKVTKETPDPVAGMIVKDESGELTGLLREKAQNLVTNLPYPHGKELTEDAIRRGITIPSALACPDISVKWF